MKSDYLKNTTIPEQIYQKFVDDIDSGKLAAGERLPGDRQLAEMYGAGRSSMISALRLLQNKGYIERLPMRGTFVRKDARRITSEIRIFSPLPETEMSPEKLGFANFLVDTEITQGLINDASKYNCNISSCYMEDSADPLKLRRQLEIIQQGSDAVVFIGHQFIHLKELVFQNNIPAVVIAPQDFWGRSQLHCITYNREDAFVQLAERIAQNGCKYLGFIKMRIPYGADRVDLEFRQNMLREQLARRDIKFKVYDIAYSSQPSESVYQEISAIFKKEKELPDTFCGPRYPTVIALQELKYKENRNFNITALTGGSIFSMIYPPVTYIRIPCVDMGRLARTTLINAVKKGQRDFADLEIPVNIWPPK